jgi:large subunit ribosomal protein L19
MLELYEKVGEGDNVRVQRFKWLVIQVKKPSHPDGTFTIRGMVAGITVERIFPLGFIKFEKVVLLDQYKTRRVRLNYIREKVGKDAKMKSILSADQKDIDLLVIAKAAVTPQAAVAAVEEQIVEVPTTETLVEEIAETPEVAASEEVAPTATDTEETVA